MASIRVAQQQQEDRVAEGGDQAEDDAGHRVLAVGILTPEAAEQRHPAQDHRQHHEGEVAGAFPVQGPGHEAHDGHLGGADEGGYRPGAD